MLARLSGAIDAIRVAFAYSAYDLLRKVGTLRRSVHVPCVTFVGGYFDFKGAKAIDTKKL